MLFRRQHDSHPPRRSLTAMILTAGAIATALIAIVALGRTVLGWFGGGKQGNVRILKLEPLRPLTYGEWRSHEGITLAGVPKDQLAIPGKLITFDVDTVGYRSNTQLPVRIIVHDVTRHRSRTIAADPVTVTAGNDCGCFDWVAIPRGQARYYIEIAIFPSGPIRGGPSPRLQRRPISRGRRRRRSLVEHRSSVNVPLGRRALALLLAH